MVNQDNPGSEIIRKIIILQLYSKPPRSCIFHYKVNKNHISFKIILDNLPLWEYHKLHPTFSAYHL